MAGDAGKEELVAVIGRNGLNQTTSGIVQDPLGAVKQPKTVFKE
jgi:hypothetical protein